MNRVITPALLSGALRIPASKSVMHRALICAALSQGSSVIQNSYLSQDIFATMDCLEELGASFQIEEDRICVEGIFRSPEEARFHCGESGSTIRFLMPIAAALGVDATFTGEGRLVTRPLDTYGEVFPQHGVQFSYSGQLPARLSGRLQPGVFSVPGDISSQFITGLLFALPLLDGDSVIEVLPPFESKSYVDLTVQVLKDFGIQVEAGQMTYRIPGRQHYQPRDYTVESDYSQAAFFLVAGALGSSVSLSRFEGSSAQGDSRILSLLEEIGVPVSRERGVLRPCPQETFSGFSIQAEDIPDLVPILCVLACFGDRPSTISRVARLRLKESDRIAATASLLQSLGGKMAYDEALDQITVVPCKGFHGGVVDGCADHRIVMAAAIAATRADSPVTITGAEAVGKSYPTFFQDYEMLGGHCHAIHVD